MLQDDTYYEDARQYQTSSSDEEVTNLIHPYRDTWHSR